MHDSLSTVFRNAFGAEAPHLACSFHGNDFGEPTSLGKQTFAGNGIHPNEQPQAAVALSHLPDPDSQTGPRLQNTVWAFLSLPLFPSDGPPKQHLSDMQRNRDGAREMG